MDGDILLVLGDYESVGYVARFLHQLNEAVRRVDAYTVLQWHWVIRMVDLPAPNVLVYHQSNELIVVRKVILQTRKDLTHPAIQLRTCYVEWTSKWKVISSGSICKHPGTN